MAKSTPPTEAPQASPQTHTPEEWAELLGTRLSLLAGARARNGWAGSQQLTQAEYEVGVKLMSSTSLGYVLPGQQPKKE